MNHDGHTVDLIPAEFRRLEQRRTRAFGWAAVALAVGFSIALISASMNRKARALENQVRPLRASVLAMQGWGDKLAPLASDLEEARKRQVVVNQLLDEPQWSALLGDLARATNDDILFSQVRLWKEKIPGEEDAPEREVIYLSIAGEATTNLEVIRFMSEISVSPQISSLRLESSRARTLSSDRSVVDFYVQGTVQWR